MNSLTTWITDPKNPETTKKILIKIHIDDAGCSISVANMDEIPFEEITIVNNGGRPTISFSSEIALISDTEGKIDECATESSGIQTSPDAAVKTPGKAIETL